MSRQKRQTLPRATLQGKLAFYEELLPLLIEAEAKGRVWVYEQVNDSAKRNLMPTDSDIYALHETMFSDLFRWAGKPRNDDRGPAGICNVPWSQVRIQLRQRFDNLAKRAKSLALDSANSLEIASVAKFTAQAHHDFQYAHPFADTNGRTGRVLDLYLLWVTFGLDRDTTEIVHFPSEAHKDEYYEGLGEADAGYTARLVAYYQERIEDAVA